MNKQGNCGHAGRCEKAPGHSGVHSATHRDHGLITWPNPEGDAAQERRDRIAAAIFGAILTGEMRSMDYAGMADDAVTGADALIHRLDDKGE